MYFKALALRLHRWIALLFALPLLVVVVTGFILSFQPIAQTMAIRPGTLSPERFNALIAKFDPEGKARSLSIDSRLNIMTLVGVGDDGETDIDLTSGEEADIDGGVSELFQTARRLHQRLVFRMQWLVIASSFAMLALAAIGLAMGFSRLRNSFSGWHKATAWFLLPLVVLSPLTGLFLAFNVTFLDNGPGRPGGPSRVGIGAGARPSRGTLADTARLASAKVDPSTILSIGARGGRMLARVVENGEVRAFAVTEEGLAPQPRNWPRSLHEGDGLWTGSLNVITSAAILVLLITGLAIWAKRSLRRRNSRISRAEPAGVGQTS